jgi:hypothetical protein
MVKKLKLVLAAVEKCLKTTGLEMLAEVVVSLARVRPSGPSMPPCSPP